MLQAIGIPHSALLSIIFGMMILSFPVGAYVFFDSKGDITHGYPLAEVNAFYDAIFGWLPFEADIGDGFVVIWAAFAILFMIATMGPGQNFIRTLTGILNSGRDPGSNRMATVLKWFGVIVFATVVIDGVQGQLGAGIGTPEFEDERILFFEVSIAPIMEEIGFRTMLMGIPLYLFFYRRTTVMAFLRALWNPHDNLDVTDMRKVMIIIAITGAIFGLAHVIVGDQWSPGKTTQAVVGGVVLGWVYYRHGLAAAIMVHWATNYFIMSYMYFVAHVYDLPLFEAAILPMMTTLEVIFVVSGGISCAFLIASRLADRAGDRLTA